MPSTDLWTVPGYTDGAELRRDRAGVVRTAVHDTTGQPVAIRYLSDELIEDAGFRAEFRDEARLLAEVSFPQVVRLFEYVECAGGVATVSAPVDGVPLSAVLDRLGPAEPEAALCVLKDCLLGLAAAHALGVLHRDCVPGNMLVDATGGTRLGDFGLTVRTGAGGTPSHRPPERWAGDPAGPHTDLYAVTATFVECLTGRPPYAAPDLERLRRQHDSAPIPLDDVPEPLHLLVASGLAKHPGDRPRQAAGFRYDVERVAVCGYGAGWEERGRSHLVGRAVALAALCPALVPPRAVPGPGGAPTRAAAAGPGRAAATGRWRRGPITAGIAAGLLLGGGVLATVLPGRAAAPVPAETATSLDGPAPAVDAWGAPPAAAGAAWPAWPPPAGAPAPTQPASGSGSGGTGSTGSASGGSGSGGSTGGAEGGSGSGGTAGSGSWGSGPGSPAPVPGGSGGSGGTSSGGVSGPPPPPAVEPGSGGEVPGDKPKPQDGGGKDGGGKDGGGKDGGGKDGGGKDGGGKDGGGKDGGSKDGGSKDGGSKDGGSKDGGAKDGPGGPDDAFLLEGGADGGGG